ncbi:MAG: SpoIIE family protein phosphatase [Flavobacteriales bacterium]|nr:SpoIIE family protein phosphatase [Flavobacteriales bacterium]
MGWNNWPIFRKTLISFVSVLLLSAGVFALWNFMMFKKEQLNLLKVELEKIKSDLNQSVIYSNEFLLWDLKDTMFFATKNTDNTLGFINEIKQINDELKNLSKDTKLSGTKVEEDLIVIYKHLIEFESVFSEIVSIVEEQGFYNFGIVGEFRDEAHYVEAELSDFVGLDDLLMLRRHEKDYMLRSNGVYLMKFIDKIDDILSNINHSDLEIIEKVEVNAHLALYRRLFDHYYFNDQMLTGNEGLLAQFKEINKTLSKDILFAQQNLSEHIELLDTRYSRYILLVMIGLVLISISVIYFLSKSLTAPIRNLSSGINHFVESNFQSKSYLGSRRRRDELGSLTDNFYRLQSEIADTFRKYREDAEIKHNKLLRQKERIEIQKFLLNEHRTLLSETNQRIQDSLNYARKIQQSLLPDIKSIKSALPNFEIWYKPKEQVSGDFYWSHVKGDYLYIGLADCTGHGVPGAILSVLGLTLLDNAVLHRELDLPSEILSYTNEEIIRILNKELTENSLYDSIDITLARIDLRRRELVICSANKDYVVVFENEISRNKPSRCSVGSSLLYGLTGNYYEDEIYSFKDAKGIILYSDGVVDQFSEKTNKKFKFKRLSDVIEKGGKPIDVISKLKSDWTKWRGTSEQTDDITVIALTFEDVKFPSFIKSKIEGDFISDVQQI